MDKYVVKRIVKADIHAEPSAPVRKKLKEMPEWTERYVLPNFYEGMVIMQ